jgi:hypothetical protein
MSNDLSKIFFSHSPHAPNNHLGISHVISVFLTLNNVSYAHYPNYTTLSLIKLNHSKFDQIEPIPTKYKESCSLDPSIAHILEDML